MEIDSQGMSPNVAQAAPCLDAYVLSSDAALARNVQAAMSNAVANSAWTPLVEDVATRISHGTIRVLIVDLRTEGVLEGLAESVCACAFPPAVIFTGGDRPGVVPFVGKRVFTIFIPASELPAQLTALMSVLRAPTAEVKPAAADDIFREMFHNANEGIWILDEQGRVELVNGRMAEILGYSVEELVGRHKTEFVFPEDIEFIQRLFGERRSGKTASVDVRFRHRSGRSVWTHMSARPVHKDGHFAGALDMFADITARREAENELRSFFELSATGNAILEPKTGRFLSINEKFCQITGRSREELLKLTFRDITYGPDRLEDDRRFERLYAGEVKEVRAQKRYVRPDNTLVWIQLVTTTVAAGGGKTVYQLSVVQDITEQRNADEQLRASQAQLRLATEAAHLGVFYYNLTTGDINWNEELRTLLGVPRDTPPSMELYLSRVHPDDVKAMRESMRVAAQERQQGKNFDSEHRMLLPDGTTKYIAAHGVFTLQVEADGSVSFIIVGTLRDVTAERAFEEQLTGQVSARTAELAEKTNQLEALLYSVAHDLRAPLRAMNAYAQILREDGLVKNAEGEAYIEKIQDSARRMDRLTMDLLDYSRFTQLQVSLEPVPIELTVDSALQELELELDRRNARVEVSPNLPTVRGSRFLIERALTNIIANASRFCPPERTPLIKVYTEVSPNKVRVCVRDNGVGIAEKYQERIFGLFEKLHSSRDYPGTGVGLAIVAMAVKRMNGRYGVESTLGEGSTFWFELDAA